MGDPRADGIIILKTDLQKVGSVGMDWIDLAQDKYRWQAHVNAVMNLMRYLNILVWSKHVILKPASSLCHSDVNSPTISVSSILLVPPPLFNMF